MNHHYTYRCSQCQRTFAADEIERNFVYLCPHCGSAERNAPLTGVLQIIYDYPAVASELFRDEFLRLPAGSPWRYPQLWPLAYDVHSKMPEGISPQLLNNFALPAKTLLSFAWKGKPFRVMDETRNPTLSFKDRASILVVLKAMQMGITEIAAASTGNAGSSLAGICARAGLKARIWVPAAIPPAKLLQIQAYGAIIHQVDGDYDLAFDQSLELSHQHHWYNRNTAYNPLTIEGKKSAAYDLFIQTEGNLPRTIFVPVGDGVIIAGLYKGLWELKELGWIDELPRLIAVQSTGSDALVRYLASGRFTFQKAHTLADSISAGAPRNLFLAARAVKESHGTALAVSDEEIIKAQHLLAREFGLLAEPAAAAAFAGFIRFGKDNGPDADENPLLLITGNGLKDAEGLKRIIEMGQI
jgi:threonine synthase